MSQRLITLSTERNNEQTGSIYADCRIYGEYTVKFTFSDLAGYTFNIPVQSNVAIAGVQRGPRYEVARFTTDRSAGRFSMQYRYNYYPGKALRSMNDTNFRYMIPASEGATVRVQAVHSLEERMGLTPSHAYHSIGFIYKKGDTICAARAGTVYAVSDQSEVGESKTQSYSGQRNFIHIQHKDETMAHYTLLAPIEMLVAPGDYVIPGQALAVFNKDAEKYHVLFSVDYLNEKKLYVNNALDAKPESPYITLPLLFANGDDKPIALDPRNTYITQHSRELMGLELSKKDKKKYNL